MGAVITVLLWGMSGFWFDFGQTWQLVINTGTTIVTFLMVFLIQGTQNRNEQAIQAKLNELILATKTASNELLCLEDSDEQELAALHEHYSNLAEKARLAKHTRNAAENP
jgi:low affinity Fe/Cu permease